MDRRTRARTRHLPGRRGLLLTALLTAVGLAAAACSAATAASTSGFSARAPSADLAEPVPDAQFPPR